MKKVNCLGFIEYIKQSNPTAYDKYLKQYTNYCNWLYNDFLVLGHVYKVQYSTFYVLDSFKPVLNDNSKELSYTFLLYFSPYNKSIKDIDSIGWVTLDQAYKMMLVDVTNTKDTSDNIISPVDCDNNVYCPYQYKILEKTDDYIEIIYTKFCHNSYVDFKWSDHTYYNRHFCDMIYRKYTYIKNDEGKYVRDYSTCLNKIRLAATNELGWCHDSDITGRNEYNGCFKNLRECKKKFIGVDTLNRLDDLFEDVNKLSIKGFVPYPINESEW